MAGNPSLLYPGYTGSFTVSGGLACNFASASDGINMRLVHVGSGTTYSFGTLPGGTCWGPSWPGNTPSGNITIPTNAPSGNYRIEIDRYVMGNLWGPTVTSVNNAVVIMNNPTWIFGKLTLDNNLNCTEDAGDLSMVNRTIEITPGPYYAVTDAQGNYVANVPAGNYNVKPSPINYTNPLCPGGGGAFAVTTSVAQDTVAGVDIYLQSTSTQPDMAGCVALAIHRPGFTITNFLTVRNDGFGTASNVVVKLKKPSWVNFNSSSIPHTSLSGDTVIWNLGNVSGQTNMTINLNMTVAVGTLGMLANYEVYFSGSLPDLNPLDNNCSEHVPVTGSYDPNDKRVWNANGDNADGPIEPTDSLLRYMIRFQNTGTDTAFNISVLDTLDPDLRFGTLRVLGSSHPYQLIYNDSLGQALNFHFPNILLVDSNQNEPLSHGFVEYTIKRKNGLATGTQLTNDASIYFDFNAPVLTNEVRSTICPLLGLNFTHSAGHLMQAFTAQSTGGANSWSWAYGDGQFGTGSTTSHTYAAPGTYNVCLIAGNACGRTDTVCQSVVVTCNPVLSSFAISASGSVNLTIQYMSTSTGPVTGITWDFGDGTTSSLANPLHTYAAPGTYNVCLIAVNACAVADTYCLPVTVACLPVTAAFSGASASGNGIQFTNTSQGPTTGYVWDFGDGNTSTTANPLHTYAAPGIYQVCLIATNLCGDADTTCSSFTVACAGTPVATFGYVLNNLAVNFGSPNQNGVVAWAWDFGDGNSSTQQNPTHTYAATGTYNVCLAVFNACNDGDTTCMQVTVTCVAPVAGFSHMANLGMVSFTDMTTNQPNTWAWDFGDGGTSAVQNPSHTYAAAGVYTVCLTASSICGQDQDCQTVNVVLSGLGSGFLSTISVAPNPSSDQMVLRMEVMRPGTAAFGLYDMHGKMVATWAEPGLNRSYQRTLSLGHLADGLYLLQITIEGEVHTLRLLKGE